MISPREITNKNFSKSTFGGYKQNEVDEYLSQIVESFSELHLKQEEQDKQIKALMERIEQYRRQEESLSSALIGAQKLGDNIVKEAKSKADLAIRDAGIKSDQMVDGAKREREREQREMGRVKKEVSNFKAKILELYKSHLEVVTALPSADHTNALSGKAKSFQALEDDVRARTTVNPEGSLNPTVSEGDGMRATPPNYNNHQTINKQNNQEMNNQMNQETNTQINQGRQQGFLPDLGLSQMNEIENPINPEYKQMDSYSPNLEEDIVKEADEHLEKIDAVNRSSKFGELRFGDNYQINRDDEKKKSNKRRKR